MTNGYFILSPTRKSKPNPVEPGRCVEKALDASRAPAWRLVGKKSDDVGTGCAGEAEICCFGGNCVIGKRQDTGKRGGKEGRAGGGRDIYCHGRGRLCAASVGTVFLPSLPSGRRQGSGNGGRGLAGMQQGD